MDEVPWALNLLERSVQLHSVSGSEAEAVGELVAYLKDAGMHAWQDDAHNLVVDAGDAPPSLYVLGHIDTVAGHVPVEQRDGQLYGRGTVDAKGPLMAAIAGLKRLDPAVLRQTGIRVIGAVGEEAPGSVGAHHAVRTMQPPDWLVIAEPSGWDRVALGYKGLVRADVATARASEHSAGPNPSASDRLVEYLSSVRQALLAWNAEGARLFDSVQPSILKLSHTHDGLEEHASARVGVRLPPDCDPQEVADVFKQQAPAHGVEVRILEALPAVRSPADGALQRAFRGAIRAQGGRPGRSVKTGTSDWNVVRRVWDVPTLAYGPGDSSLDHTPNEHVAVDEFERAVRVWQAVYVAMVEHLTGKPTQ